jgi:hypothetical protein
MRIDWYTKGVLTVIAVLLGVIALRPYVSPDAVAHAQGSFAGMQYGGGKFNPEFFDSRTGDMYDYEEGFFKTPLHLRMTKPGAPLVEVK